jgi:hypothetical protein
MKIGRHAAAQRIDVVRIVAVDLDRGNVVGAVEIGLRLRHRHEHESGVVFRHADLEHGGDLVGLDPGRSAHGGDRTAGRDQRQGIPDVSGELIGKSLADDQTLARIESVDRALADVVGDRGKLHQIGGTDAAHQHPGSIERRGGKGLAFDDGRRQSHSGDAGNPRSDRLPVGQRRIQRLDQQVAVEPEDLIEQLLAEPVHHRHDDDQRGHPEQDAEEGEPGDDRNEALFATGAQIAQRQHPLERGKGPGCDRLVHESCPRLTDFIRFRPLR